MGWQIKNCLVVILLGFLVPVPAHGTVSDTGTPAVPFRGQSATPSGYTTHPVVLPGKTLDF